MQKRIAAALIGLAALTAPQLAVAGYDFNDTCAYFEKRSQGKPTGPNAPWIVQVTESCTTALDRVHANDATKADEQFLTRLEKFRRFVTLLAVNRIRIHKEREAETGVERPLRQIWLTQTGEYLIARKLEVTKAHDIWLNETVSVEMAGVD